MRDRRRAARPAVPLVPVVAVLAALLAGCASIPSTGPVRQGRDLRLEREDSAVRVIGQPPAKGARPQDIVRGFLQASADFVNDHATARLYLAPPVRQRWRSTTGTAVYDRTEGAFTLEPGPGGAVRLSAAEVARIDAEGHYAPAPRGSRLERTFQMVRVAGEWRISALPDGLVLTRSDLQETYRQLNLYFLSPSRSVLVPDTVFLPAVAGLSTALVNRLLRGPTSQLRGAVTTAFPRGTSLAVTSVPVREGIARVNLDAGALGADAETRERMSAQLVWTLKQLPEIQSVRITADGESLGVRGVGQDQPRDAWGSYDPAGLTQGTIAYVVRSGRVGRVVEGRFTAVAGPAGDGRVPVRRPGVSLDAALLAAVSADGHVLLVGRLVEEGNLVPRLRGGELSAPSWDLDGNVWTVDRATGQVWQVRASNDRPVAVRVPALAAGRVSGLRVARDGTRVAVVVGEGAAARLYVGSVIRRQDDPSVVTLTALREVLPQLRNVRDVAWSDATTLAVLGSEDGEPVGPLLADTDGYSVTPVEPQPGLVSLAAAPVTRPLLAGDQSGALLQYTSGRGWVSLGAGSDPTYPG